MAGASAQTDTSFNASFAQQTSATQSSSYVPDGATTELANSHGDLANGSVHVPNTDLANGSTTGQISMATAFVGDSFTHTAGLNPFGGAVGDRRTPKGAGPGRRRAATARARTGPAGVPPAPD